VVDNNTNDETQLVCQEFKNRLPHFRVVIEKTQGIAYARNRAVAEANAEWIGFVDDDAMMSNEWLAVAEEEIKRNCFDAVGGPYVAWHRYGPPPVWFDDQWASNNPKERPNGELSEGNYPTSGSCIFKSCWGHQIVFPTHLGMSGGKTGYGEETYFFRKMKEKGAIIGWRRELLIHHCVLPIKYSFIWRVNSYFLNGKDSIQTQYDFHSFKRILSAAWMIPIIFFESLFEWVKNRQADQGKHILTKFFNYGWRPLHILGQLWGEMLFFLQEETRFK